MAVTGRNAVVLAEAVAEGVGLLGLFAVSENAGIGSVENAVEMSLQNVSASKNKPTRANTSGNPGGDDRTARNGDKRGSNGSGNDNDFVWKMILKSRPPKMRLTDNPTRTFLRVGDSKFWLSPDSAGHGGSHCKLYTEKGNSLDFVGSVPITIFIRPIYEDQQRLNEILKTGAQLDDFDLINKCESHRGEKIKMNKLSVTREK